MGRAHVGIRERRTNDIRVRATTGPNAATASTNLPSARPDPRRWMPKYGFDKKVEVLEGHALEWIHAESLVGVCHVERCSAAVFNNMVESRKLPSNIPCFFTREPAPEALERLAVEGVFLPDSKNADLRTPSKFIAPSEALQATRRRRGRGRTARPGGAPSTSGSTSTRVDTRPHTTGGALGRSRGKHSSSPQARTRSRTRGATRARKGRSRSPARAGAGSGGSPPARSDLDDGSFSSSLKLPVMGPGNLSMYKR